MAETSPSRRSMIEDMTVRDLSPATQRSYVHAVSKFSRLFGRSPETLTLEDVRTYSGPPTYQVHLVSKGVAWASLNQTVAAPRFFRGVPLGMAEIPERIAYAREPRRPTGMLSADEVVRSLEAVPSLKARGADDRLRGRAAGVRGHRPRGRRHRRRPDGGPHRARQGRQGALRDAVGAAARDPAHLLAAGTSRALAGSRARRDPPARADDAARGLSVGAGGGGDQQECDGAYPLARLCHPSAGEGGQHPGDPGFSGARAPVDHGALHPCLARSHRPDGEPVGSVEARRWSRQPEAPPSWLAASR